MISRKEIFKRAWQIKKENSANIFSLCLKMAWAEAREAKVESREEKIERLSRKYSRWTKNGYDRIYFNASDFLEFEGNKIWYNGNPVTKTAASRLTSEKAYLDLNTGRLVIGELMEQYFGDVIRAEVGR